MNAACRGRVCPTGTEGILKSLSLPLLERIILRSRNEVGKIRRLTDAKTNSGAAQIYNAPGIGIFTNHQIYTRLSYDVLKKKLSIIVCFHILAILYYILKIYIHSHE